MLKELWAILRGDEMSGEIGEDFKKMLEIVQQMLLDASEIYWTERPEAGAIRPLYASDIHVNRLQRQIRKRLVAHLGAGTSLDVPYGLLIMSLAKDVERLGDYAKNLAEISTIRRGPFPEGACLDELKSVRDDVEELVRRFHDAYLESDVELSKELIRKGRAVSRRADRLIEQIAASDFKADAAVAMVLGARFYKRIEAHVLNLLSGVVMPLHKLDYYDENAVRRFREGETMD